MSFPSLAVPLLLAPFFSFLTQRSVERVPQADVGDVLLHEIRLCLAGLLMASENTAMQRPKLFLWFIATLFHLMGKQ